jgi:hypothetical protein
MAEIGTVCILVRLTLTPLITVIFKRIHHVVSFMLMLSSGMGWLKDAPGLVACWNESCAGVPSWPVKQSTAVILK